MSHPAQLPPRRPFQNRGPINWAVDSSSLAVDRDDELQVQHHRFPSQCSLFEEWPLWFDDLLGESGMSPKGVYHRRSSSDTVAVSEASSTFLTSTTHVDKQIPISDGTYFKTPEQTQEIEACGGLEAGCVYGPNSPRRRANLTHSESSIVSALFENVPRNPFQYVAVNRHRGSDTSQFGVKGDAHVAIGNFDQERTPRRHSGQRSRVRKLQYIAELERTVNVFQTLEADLAARVASLFQQRAVLYAENNTLKQQIVSLQKERMIKDGQHQYLKNEVKSLKTVYGRHRKSKSVSCFQMDRIETDTLDTSWQGLDMGKLSLGGSPVPLDRFRS